MIFRKQIEEQARKAALHFLVCQQIGDQALQSIDAIAALARGAASYFYQYGTIFYLLKASFLGTRQEITDCYGYTFAHTYNYFKDQPPSVIQEVRAKIDAILTADEADQWLRKDRPTTDQG